MSGLRRRRALGSLRSPRASSGTGDTRLRGPSGFDGDREAGGARGFDDRLGVVGAADLERGVDAGLADAEIEPLALVLHFDQVGAAVGERAQEVDESARAV